MELESSFCFIFFLFTIIFSLFSLLIFVSRLRPCCDCHVCKSYLSRSWAADFPNLIDWYAHLLQKSPTGTIHVHVLGNVITANPENVEYMLKTKFENYPKGKQFSSILGDLLGRGIFNVDGESWKFQRKMASLELGSVSVRTHAFDIVMSEIRSRLVPLLSSSNGGVLDMQDILRRFSFDTICKFSFGLDPGCLNLSLPVSDFADAFDLASRLSAQRALLPSPWIWKLKRFFNLGSERELREAIKVINLLADEMIRDRRKMGFDKENDLLSRFMSSINDDKYLRDFVISFLLAGRDTVASALTSFFALLSKHPKIESKIREELDRVMGLGEEGPISFEQTRGLHYLQASLHESMRLYPPVQFDSKFSQDDDVLPDGTFVSRGTRVTYHAYSMGRMERIWGPDCLEFKPKRWLQNGVFKQENPFKYPVFQGGVRVCLGKELALVEMKSIAISLIRKFDIRAVTPSQTPQFVPGLTATVSGGLPVTIRERSRTALYELVTIVNTFCALVYFIRHTE